MTTQSGAKISEFLGNGTISAADLLTFVANNTNYKISFSDFLTALGAIGTIESLGEITYTPVLNKSGTVNQIRAIGGGSGVAPSLSAGGGITLDHNFTVDKTGVPVLINETAESPTIRSISAGAGIAVAASGNEIEVALSATPVSTKTVVVNSISDFPTPVSGVITLVADTDYQITNDITTSNRFVLADSTVIRGTDSTVITLEYTGSGSMFTGTSVTSKLTNITLKCSSGTLLTITSSVAGKGFQMINATVSECDKIGTVTAYEGFQFLDVFFSNVISQGLRFTGANTVASFTNLIINKLTGAPFPAIDLGTATFTSLSISNSTAFLGASVPLLEGVAGVASANINSGGLGSVVATKAYGTSVALSNITKDDYLWEFSGNLGIQDTKEAALDWLRSNTTETVISVASTPVKIAGTWAVFAETSKFAGDGTGKLTYKGPKPVEVPVTASFTGSPVTGTNIPITYHLYKNGSKVTNAEQENIITSTSPKNTTLIWQLSLVTDDYLELYVSNDSTTSNVLVSDVTFRIN